MSLLWANFTLHDAINRLSFPIIIGESMHYAQQSWVRSSISPRKQLWIKAVKKLTSERLGREGLAAWEDRKSNGGPDPEVAAGAKDVGQAPAENVEAAKTDPEAASGAEQAVADEEAQTQRGTKSRSPGCVWPDVKRAGRKG